MVGVCVGVGVGGIGVSVGVLVGASVQVAGSVTPVIGSGVCSVGAQEVSAIRRINKNRKRNFEFNFISSPLEEIISFYMMRLLVLFSLEWSVH